MNLDIVIYVSSDFQSPNAVNALSTILNFLGCLLLSESGTRFAGSKIMTQLKSEN